MDYIKDVQQKAQFLHNAINADYSNFSHLDPTLQAKVLSCALELTMRIKFGLPYGQGYRECVQAAHTAYDKAYAANSALLVSGMVFCLSPVPFKFAACAMINAISYAYNMAVAAEQRDVAIEHCAK
jgi:hypothetical protein